jgi:phospho-N-acetylmuramoyl-pentapeptide-transferase
MIYHLIDYLSHFYDFPGKNLLRFISFRAGASALLALFIILFFGNAFIRFLKRKQIGEAIRTDGPEHHHSKAGTPTMGGLLILIAILVPIFLFANLTNAYILTLILSTVWIGLIGFIDDYIKVFKKQKKGLRSVFKLIGQVGLGLIVGIMMVTHPHFSGKIPHIQPDGTILPNHYLKELGFQKGDRLVRADNDPFTPTLIGKEHHYPFSRYYVKRHAIDTLIPIHIPEEERYQTAIELFGQKDLSFVFRTDVPFLKDYTLNYGKLAFWSDDPFWTKLIYILVVIFIITAVSNGANLTDGLDGLAAGTSAISATALAIFAYLSGHYIFASYLHITYIPLSGEITVFIAALIGACIGFLWFNTYPAQIFMGDTGSLSLGGIIAVISLMLKKELLLPLICGVFFLESLSVILQVSYFKYTKRRYGEGKRIFRMAPLHHHFELLGIPEPKVVTRFWIIAILCATAAFLTLKLR